MHNTENIEYIPSSDVPVYGLPELPDNGYVLLLANSPYANNGCGGSGIFKLPLNRITPGGSLQTGLYSLFGGGATVAIPDRQVVPAYLTATMPNMIQAANANSLTSKAKFLILSVDANDSSRYIIQSSGFYTFPEGHNYVIGQQYYLADGADSGRVTTVPPANAQPIFYVLDRLSILINIGA